MMSAPKFTGIKSLICWDSKHPLASRLDINLTPMAGGGFDLRQEWRIFFKFPQNKHPFVIGQGAWGDFNSGSQVKLFSVM
jgi:hypothetical protein